MRLQVSFDTHDLEKALTIAEQIKNYVDVFEIGTIMIYKHGVKAVEQFKNAFPQKTIFVDSKIADRGKEAVTQFAAAGANWITVMSGTSKDVIHAACSAAENANVNVMLDLLDACSLGQSAFEAQNLGASALLFHQPHDEQDGLTFLDKWDMVKGNTNLPIFVAAKIKRETIEAVLNVHPDGLVIGRSIVEAENPAAEAQYFYELLARQ